MKIDMIIIGVIAALSGLFALYTIFGIAGAITGAAVMLIYALLLNIKPKKLEEKTFIQNIRFKVPIIIVLAVILWVLAGKFNFPVWWQIEFVSFALVGFFFAFAAIRSSASSRVMVSGSMLAGILALVRPCLT